MHETHLHVRRARVAGIEPRDARARQSDKANEGENSSCPKASFLWTMSESCTLSSHSLDVPLGVEQHVSFHRSRDKTFADRWRATQCPSAYFPRRLLSLESGQRRRSGVARNTVKRVCMCCPERVCSLLLESSLVASRPR